MLVDGINAILRTAISAYAQLFSAFDSFLGLVLASAVIGLGMLWVVGKTSDQAAIERSKKLMQAHLLEMRLYQDELGLLLRAQGNLLLNNGKYLGHMLRPAVFLALPMVLLFAHFDSVYGRRPLVHGESVLVLARTDPGTQDLALLAADGFRVEATPVHMAATGETAWRVRATDGSRGSLTLETPGGNLSKTIVAGGSAVYVSGGRSGSWWQRLLFFPGESGYDLPAAQRLEIDYPRIAVGPEGLQTHWVVWFLGISILTAYVLRRRFGVVL